MELSISIVYYLMTTAITAVLFTNFLRTRDVQQMVLYAVVIMPFVLRVFRLK